MEGPPPTWLLKEAFVLSGCCQEQRPDTRGSPHRAVCVSSLHCSLPLPELVIQERKSDASVSFMAHLEVTEPYFCFILFIRRESRSPTHTREVRNEALPLESFRTISRNVCTSFKPKHTWNANLHY